MARGLRFQPGFVVRLALELARKMPDAIGQAVNEVKPSLAPTAKVMVERLKAFVLSTTKRTAARIAA